MNMKKAVLFIGFAILAVFVSKSQTVFTDPVLYNDYIVKQQTMIGEKITNFSSCLANENRTKEEAQTSYSDLLKVIDKAIENTKNITIYKDKQGNGDFDLKTNALSLFKFYREYVSEVYSIALEEVFKTTPDYTKFTEKNTVYTEKEKNFDEKFLSSQKKFAEFYHFTLETEE